MALYNPRLIKKLQEHIKQNPESKSFCSLAQIYFDKGEWEKAEKICLEGLVYNPSYSPAHIILGEIYKDQGKIEKAIQCFTRAKGFSPDNPNIYKNLGEIYRKQNDMEKTLKAYKMLAFLKPGDKTALSVIQHLEKVIDRGFDSVGDPDKKEEEKKKSSSLQEEKTKESNLPFPETLSRKEKKKLSKLNEILARVEVYINKNLKEN